MAKDKHPTEPKIKTCKKILREYLNVKSIPGSNGNDKFVVQNIATKYHWFLTICVYIQHNNITTVFTVMVIITAQSVEKITHNTQVSKRDP